MHCRLDDAAALEEQIRESEAAHPRGLVRRRGGVAQRRARRAHQYAGHRAERAAALDAWSSRAAASAAARCAPGICPSAARTSTTAAGSCCATCRCPRTCRRVITGCEIDLEFAGRESCPLIVAPEQVLRAGGARRGRASSGAWPCSSTRCVRRTTGASAISPISPKLLRLAAAPGAGFVGISPVHALFPSDPDAVLAVFGLEPACAERHVHRRGRGARSAGLARARRPSWPIRVSARGSRRCAPPRRWTIRRSPASRCRCCEAAFERFRTEHLAAAHGARRGMPRVPARTRRGDAPAHAVRRASTAICAAHHGTGAGWHNWPEEYRDPGERGGAALRAASMPTRWISMATCSGSRPSS